MLHLHWHATQACAIPPLVKLTVNGDDLEVPAPLTVRGLLDHLGIGERPVVVEVNQRALLPRELGASPLHDGDRVEVVQITAGG